MKHLFLHADDSSPFTSLNIHKWIGSRRKRIEWGSVALQPAAHKINVIGLANWNVSLVIQCDEKTEGVRVRRGERWEFSFYRGRGLAQWAYVSKVTSHVWLEKRNTKWMNPKQKLIFHWIEQNTSNEWLLLLSGKGRSGKRGRWKEWRGNEIYVYNHSTFNMKQKWINKLTKVWKPDSSTVLKLHRCTTADNWR